MTSNGDANNYKVIYRLDLTQSQNWQWNQRFGLTLDGARAWVGIEDTEGRLRTLGSVESSTPHVFDLTQVNSDVRDDIVAIEIHINEAAAFGNLDTPGQTTTITIDNLKLTDDPVTTQPEEPEEPEEPTPTNPKEFCDSTQTNCEGSFDYWNRHETM